MSAAESSEVQQRVLYMHPVSPFAIANMIVLDSLSVPYEKKHVDLFSKEQRGEPFLKINPMGQVPVLDDNGFVLTESRAIHVYVVEKYGGDQCALYPALGSSDRAVNVRAQILAYMNFDIGTLYPAIKEYVYPQIIYRPFTHQGDPDMLTKLDEVVAVLEQMVSRGGGCRFLVGDELTLADIMIFCSCRMAMMIDYDFDRYPAISKWMKAVKEKVPCRYFKEMLEYKAQVEKEKE